MRLFFNLLLSTVPKMEQFLEKRLKLLKIVYKFKKFKQIQPAWIFTVNL